MKINWKKMTTVMMSAMLGTSVILSAVSTSVKAQEETLVISAGGHYDYLVEHIADFEATYGVKVELLDEDMLEKLEGLTLDGPAGTAPDVLIAPYDRIGGLSQTGQLAPVTISDDERYDETDLRQVTVDDVVYGAPAVIETLVLYYNKDLLSQAPTTFDELRALTEDEQYAFEGEEGKSTAFLAPWTNFYYSYGLIAGYGGYVFGDNGTNPQDIGLNTPESVEGIEYAVDWFKNVWPQGMLDITSSGEFVTQSFIEGKTAAIIDGPWQASAYSEAGVNYGVAKIPTLPNGQDYAPFAGGKGWVISNYSTQKELAQQFLDWVTSPEQQVAMYETISEIPANQTARQQVLEEGNELSTAVIEVYAGADPMPNIPEMAEVWAGAENLMFDAAISGQAVSDVANDAVELIKQSIEQKY